MRIPDTYPSTKRQVSRKMVELAASHLQQRHFAFGPLISSVELEVIPSLR